MAIDVNGRCHACGGMPLCKCIKPPQPLSFRDQCAKELAGHVLEAELRRCDGCADHVSPALLAVAAFNFADAMDAERTRREGR